MVLGARVSSFQCVLELSASTYLHSLAAVVVLVEARSVGLQSPQHSLAAGSLELVRSSASRSRHRSRVVRQAAEVSVYIIRSATSVAHKGAHGGHWQWITTAAENDEMALLSQVNTRERQRPVLKCALRMREAQGCVLESKYAESGMVYSPGAGLRECFGSLSFSLSALGAIPPATTLSHFSRASVEQCVQAHTLRPLQQPSAFLSPGRSSAQYVSGPQPCSGSSMSS